MLRQKDLPLYLLQVCCYCLFQCHLKYPPRLFISGHQMCMMEHPPFLRLFVLFRFFDSSYGESLPQWKLVLAFIVAATLFIGNITAVFQQSVKRMLAYSSIAQAGFMLFALFGYNEFAKEGIILYSAAYSLATVGI